MLASDTITLEIFKIISKLIHDNAINVSGDTPLIGGGGVLDSMRLVELCLALEDMALEIGFEFDWTSEVAMSRTKSMFRTAGSLTTEFLNQMASK